MTDAALGAGKHFPQAAPIDAYGNGGFRFAGLSHRGSLLCMPDGIWAWDVARADQIDEQSLRLVVSRASELDTLIIGTGANLAALPAKLRDRLREAGVVVDTMQTGPAIRIYNVMIGERRRVAAALIAVV